MIHSKVNASSALLVSNASLGSSPSQSLTRIVTVTLTSLFHTMSHKFHCQKGISVHLQPCPCSMTLPVSLTCSIKPNTIGVALTSLRPLPQVLLMSLLEHPAVPGIPFHLLEPVCCLSLREPGQSWEPALTGSSFQLIWPANLISTWSPVAQS